MTRDPTDGDKAPSARVSVMMMALGLKPEEDEELMEQGRCNIEQEGAADSPRVAGTPDPAASVIAKRHVPTDGGPAYLDQVQSAGKRLATQVVVRRTVNNEEQELAQGQEDAPTQAERQTNILITTARPVPENEDEDKDKCKCTLAVDRSKIYRALVALGLVAAIVVAFVAGYCGAGNCSNDETLSTTMQQQKPPPTIDETPAPTAFPTTAVPTSQPTMKPPFESLPGQDRSTNIAAFINYITLTGTTIDYPIWAGGYHSPEELALKWLIESDPLQLTVDTATGCFRLQQRYALASFWFSTKQGTWKDSSGWLNETECTWNGVTCSVQDLSADIGLENVVTGLDLRGSNVCLGNIQGRIPSDIALLTSLERLDLFCNAFTGTIPDSLFSGLLMSVERLILDHNSITGTIPEMSRAGLPSLLTLDLSSNGLTGTLPDSIAFLTSLEKLDVQINSISGAIPQMSQGSLPSLSTLILRWNSLTGTLPDSIAFLTSLKFLDLRSNVITGTLPDTIGNGLSNLESFYLHGNAFSGTLPESISAWTSVNNFYVDNNAFTGTLPNSIGAWTNLNYFSIFSNAFTGTVPDSIGAWTKIRYALFHNNAFTGTMPTSICNATSIQQLEADCLSEIECFCCTKCY